MFFSIAYFFSLIIKKFLLSALDIFGFILLDFIFSNGTFDMGL
jgi:hypothetical protein